jgi:tRNA threonylcarbamoyladenosine biosynthesis protein TsaB
MPSFRELVAAHAPLLVIDAASTRVQVGWVADEIEMKWETCEDEAGVAVFSNIEKLGCEISAANAFVFCDGPGSILGIRTVAMALRTWNVLKPRPMFAYSSLAVVAHALGRSDVGVIADARRDTWHHYQIGGGLRRVEAASLSGELVTPECFRNWSALPANVQRVPYSVPEMLPRVADEDLFLGTEAPDAFLHEEPSYVTWTPRIHRAPAP